LIGFYAGSGRLSVQQAGGNLMAFLDAFKAIPRPETATAFHSKERGD
jgi:hypothetical protein